MKIYVCHHLPLTDRYDPMIAQLDKYNYNYEFMTHHPTGSDLDMFNKNMHSSECSLVANHLECFKQIAESDEDYSLILEDDAIFAEDFNTKLAPYLSELPSDFDLFFIGGGCGLNMENINDKRIVYFRPPRYNCTRGTAAFFVSKAGAKKINKYLMENPQINKPMDHWLNNAGKRLRLCVYWAEPTIIHQGSETPQYKSSLKPVRYKSDRK